MHDCVIYVYNNSRLEIGDRTEIERCSISVGNDASLLVGANGKFFGEGSLESSADSLLKFGNDFTVGARYNLVAGKGTECIIGHVWIGIRVTVLYNTLSGDGSIIGAESLVKSKIPNNCIAAGNPAKVIKKNVTWCRFEDSEDIAECGEAYIHFTDENAQ